MKKNEIRDDEIRVIKEKEIRDDEIRVIGEEKTRFKGWKWLLLLLAGIIIGGIIWMVLPSTNEELYDEDTEESYMELDPIPCPPPDFEDDGAVTKDVNIIAITPLAKAEETGHGFIEIADTTINDIPMRLYLPHRVSMSLHLGTIDYNDPSILFAAMAADIRDDNNGIVGAFVLKGELKAKGLRKKGYCAIINDTVTVGVDENSPLFEKAIENEGYFFRQYPLVDNGRLVENEPKGKSVRRALCDREGEIFTVETLTSESFHDFAQALVDLGVDNGIYLVGSTSYGWATDAKGQRHEFGDPTKIHTEWENLNYLIMRERP